MAKKDLIPNTKAKNEIVDIDLGTTKKQRFRIDGDDDRILELNTSDLDIMRRLQEVYGTLQTMSNEAAEKWDKAFGEDTDSDNIDIEGMEVTEAIEALTEIDKKMREQIDYLFDSNVSEICVPHGTMYDPLNGQFRFEHIIDVLSGLYADTLTKEMQQMTMDMKKHTDKYTRKK